jgi:hypothetical protein
MRVAAFSAGVTCGVSIEGLIRRVSGGFRFRRSRNGPASKWAVAVVALAAVMGNPALASDEFSGTYVQNRPCHGDGTDPKPLIVKITPDEIDYRGGVCSLSDRRQDGNTISARATCKSKNGAILSGDITLTLRPDRNLDMVDQDKAYTSVLNRCPE